MDFKRFILSEEDVRAIKELASLRDEEYLNIQSNDFELSFTKFNNTSVKIYTLPISNLGLFNIRVKAPLISSALTDGYIGIRIGQMVEIAIAPTELRFNDKDFSRAITFEHQDGRDNQIAKLLQMIKLLKSSNGYNFYNPQALGILNTFSKIDTKGVLFKEGKVYTDGYGFKAYCESEYQHLEMAVGVDALDMINKLSRKLHESEPMTLWEQDNYLFMKDGNLIHGYKKSRSDLPLGLEALTELVPKATIKIDLTDIAQQLKGLAITKASDYKIELDLSTGYLTITDPGRYVVRTKIGLSEYLDEVILFSDRVIKPTLTALYFKTSPLVEMTIYDNVITFKNSQGINLIVGRV